MGIKDKSRLQSKILILFFTSLMILSILSISNSILNKSTNIFPSTQVPSGITPTVDDIISTKSFENFKQFNVTENTGLNQTNVIIDPIYFTEIDKYCFKDSIRIYKSPYGTSDELVSQVYDLEPKASETFSSSTDWGDPNGWIVTERPNTKITVLPRFQGYKKVVEMYDNTSSGNYCDMKYKYASKTSGTFYVTIMTTTKNTSNAIALTGFDGYVTGIGFYNSGHVYYSDDPVEIPHHFGFLYEVNKWYTFKMTFDCSSDKYSVWYWDENNQIWAVLGLNIGFVVPQGYVDQTWFHTSGTDKGTFYIAAMDYSWDIGYEEDRILYVSSANIAFIDNLTASETKKYQVYYNSSPTMPVAYTNIARTNYTVNFTDGASVLMHTANNVNYDILRQFDKNGNEHLSGRADYHETSTYDTGAGGWILNEPIISDGPIFIETWHVESSSRWSSYRYFANSYIYKYHNYPGSGVTGWFVWGAEANEATIDFNGVYYHQSSSWQYEAFDYTGPSWQSHPNAVDAGKMFQEDTGDPNILITLWDTSQDPYLDDILIRECGWPNPANVFVTIGRNPSTYAWEVTNSFGAWQFFLDAGSTNVTNKQDFVDNLYDIVITNPPTISPLGLRNDIVDTEPPNILEINLNQKKYRPLDTLNITVHVTDNEQVSHVLLCTNLYGTLQYLEMNLISGTTISGFWSYNTTIPLNASKKIINYSIWANDTSGQVNSSAVYQFKVKKNPKPIIIIPPEEDITIIIIIIIGSVAGSSIVVSTVIIRKRTPKVLTKKKSMKVKAKKPKAKKPISLGAEEIRKILKESEAQTSLEKISYDELKELISEPIKVISRDTYLRVIDLKNLTIEEKNLLLRDLATLDEKQREEWLKEVEELEE